MYVFTRQLYRDRAPLTAKTCTALPSPHNALSFLDVALVLAGEALGLVFVALLADVGAADEVSLGYIGELVGLDTEAVGLDAGLGHQHLHVVGAGVGGGVVP